MGAITGDYKDERKENEQIQNKLKEVNFKPLKASTDQWCKFNNETTYQGTYKP